MRRIVRGGVLVPVLAVTVAAGCNDRLPTLSGEGPFPVGGVATTIEHLLTASDFVLAADAYGGPTGPDEFPALFVARDFGGELSSHALATFASFPDSIVVAGESDGDFTYMNSEVIAAVPDTLRVSHSTLTLELWTLTQPWTAGAVSWENAKEDATGGVPWTEPGGSRGELVSVTTWSRADTAVVADSLFWAIPASLVNRLANEELPGLMVTLANDNARIRISELSLRATIAPSVADTTVERTIAAGEQTFVFTPEPPQSAEVLRVGGLTSDRSVLRMRLPTELPACPAPHDCSAVPASEVSLNRVELLLDPVPVEDGFFPESTLRLSLRRVLQPELGERAPLGPLISQDTVAAARFTQAGVRPVRFILTGGFLEALLNEEDELAIAIAEEPEAFSFGYAWFQRNPRLRLLYTLPEIPRLP